MNERIDGFQSFIHSFRTHSASLTKTLKTHTQREKRPSKATRPPRPACSFFPVPSEELSAWPLLPAVPKLQRHSSRVCGRLFKHTKRNRISLNNRIYTIVTVKYGNFNVFYICANLRRFVVGAAALTLAQYAGAP